MVGTTTSMTVIIDAGVQPTMKRPKTRTIVTAAFKFFFERGRVFGSSECFCFKNSLECGYSTPMTTGHTIYATVPVGHQYRRDNHYEHDNHNAIPLALDV